MEFEDARSGVGASGEFHDWRNIIDTASNVEPQSMPCIIECDVDFLHPDILQAQGE